MGSIAKAEDAPTPTFKCLSAGALDARLGSGTTLAIFVCAVLLLLPGITTPFFDRDEGWYAEVSREMLATGDWLIPRYLREPWIAKPPLLYWPVVLLWKWFGIAEWSARLPSVLAMAVSTVLVARMGASLWGRRAGLWASACFITSFMPAIVGRLLLADALMLAWTLGAILVHLRMVQAGVSWSRAMVYGLLIGLGVMTKGPATLLFAGGFALALLWVRQGGWLRSPRFWIAPLIALGVSGPWYLYATRHAGAALGEQFLWRESFARILGAPHGHSSPPGMCLAVSLGGFLPWTPAVVIALIAAFQKRRDDGRVRLLLVWTALPWLIVELMRGKLPHYVLPCYAPIAMLVGRQITAVLGTSLTDQQRADTRAIQRVWMVLLLLVGAGLAGGALWRRSDLISPLIATSVALPVSAVLGLLAIRRGCLKEPFYFAAAGGAAVQVLVGLWLLPAGEPQRLNTRIARAIVERYRPGDRILICDIAEPTIYFYVQAAGLPEPRKVEAGELADLQAATPPYPAVIVEADFNAPTDVAAQPILGSDPVTMRGLNFGNMKQARVRIWRTDETLNGSPITNDK